MFKSVKFPSAVQLGSSSTTGCSVGRDGCTEISVSEHGLVTVVKKRLNAGQEETLAFVVGNTPFCAELDPTPARQDPSLADRPPKK